MQFLDVIPADSRYLHRDAKLSTDLVPQLHHAQQRRRVFQQPILPQKSHPHHNTAAQQNIRPVAAPIPPPANQTAQPAALTATGIGSEKFKIPVRKLVFKAPPQPKSKLTWRQVAGYVAIIPLAIVITLVSASLTYSQIVIALFALAVFIFRVRSQFVFSLALCALALVPIFLLFKQQDLAENYAVYSFFLLIIGIATATREVRQLGYRHRARLQA